MFGLATPPGAKSHLRLSSDSAASPGRFRRPQPPVQTLAYARSAQFRLRTELVCVGPDRVPQQVRVPPRPPWCRERHHDVIPRLAAAEVGAVRVGRCRSRALACDCSGPLARLPPADPLALETASDAACSVAAERQRRTVRSCRCPRSVMPMCGRGCRLRELRSEETSTASPSTCSSRASPRTSRGDVVHRAQGVNDLALDQHRDELPNRSPLVFVMDEIHHGADLVGSRVWEPSAHTLHDVAHCTSLVG